jgi:hypothetical protein
MLVECIDALELLRSFNKKYADKVSNMFEGYNAFVNGYPSVTDEQRKMFDEMREELIELFTDHALVFSYSPRSKVYFDTMSQALKIILDTSEKLYDVSKHRKNMVQFFTQAVTYIASEFPEVSDTLLGYKLRKNHMGSILEDVKYELARDDIEEADVILADEDAYDTFKWAMDSSPWLKHKLLGDLSNLLDVKVIDAIIEHFDLHKQ